MGMVRERRSKFEGSDSISVYFSLKITPTKWNRIFRFILIFIQDGQMGLKGHEDISGDLIVLDRARSFLVPIYPLFAEEGIIS